MLLKMHSAQTLLVELTTISQTLYLAGLGAQLPIHHSLSDRCLHSVSLVIGPSNALALQPLNATLFHIYIALFQFSLLHGNDAKLSWQDGQGRQSR